MHILEYILWLPEYSNIYFKYTGSPMKVRNKRLCVKNGVKWCKNVNNK